MKRIILATTLLAGVAISTAAVAASPDWTGSYLGGEVGYGWGNSTGGDYNRATGAAEATGDVDPDGFVGGLYGGYNHQFATHWVLGVEGNIDWANMDGSADPLTSGPDNLPTTPLGTPFPGESAKSEVNWDGALRLRVGYAAGRFLPYVAAGVAFAHYKFTPTYGGSGAFPGSKTETGWTAGVGLEYAVSNHLVTRVEYRYSDFGHATYDIPGYPIYETRVDLKTSEVRFGLSYKF